MNWIDSDKGNKDELPSSYSFELTTCPFCEGKGLVPSTLGFSGDAEVIDCILPCLICNGAGMVDKSEYETLASKIERIE